MTLVANAPTTNHSAPTTTITRTDWRIALLLSVIFLALYLRMLAPGLLSGDSGEFQFAAWRLGLAHPTGYPLYLLLGSGWQHLLALLGIDPAAALNAFSAFIGAATIGLLYLLMIHWLPGPAFTRRLAATLGATLLAVTPTFWSQNLIAEVYTLHAMLVVAIFLAATALWQNIEGGEESSTAAPPLLPSPLTPGQLAPLGLLTGLAFTHHATTLLLLPSLCGLLWLLWRRCRISMWAWVTLLLAGLLPLLLYLYIPLRSGPASSPWYHQPLGNGVLTLYTHTWSSFFAFISGQAISVGFHGPAQALTNLPEMGMLWRLNFTWPGIILMGWGGVALVLRRQWPLLLLTAPYLIVQQIFNLFYNIGDILVYYIPLYLVGAIWVSYGAANLVGGPWREGEGGNGEGRKRGREEGGEVEKEAEGEVKGVGAIGWVFILLLFWVPLNLSRTYLPVLDQSESGSARQMWDVILAAQPEPNAILISNDRNEIVPLFYLQAVEGQAIGITGLFPLIKPEPGYDDIGATIESAWLAESATARPRPIFLIKEMPGLEAKFNLSAATPPLVQVQGPAASHPPQAVLDQPFGPLMLRGYTIQPQTADKIKITLQWQVQQPLSDDYTTTLQLFARSGEKIAQDDRPPGGIFYPTSQWKVGETLVDRHIVSLATTSSSIEKPTKMLVGMYEGDTFSHLAPPLEFTLPE